MTAADVGSCGTFDASDDGRVYVGVEETTPASALRRQDGRWATTLLMDPAHLDFLEETWLCVLQCVVRVRIVRGERRGRMVFTSAISSWRIYFLRLSKLSFRTFATRAGGFGVGASVFGHFNTSQRISEFIF